jgi:hypothetical protein
VEVPLEGRKEEKEEGTVGREVGKAERQVAVGGEAG